MQWERHLSYLVHWTLEAGGNFYKLIIGFSKVYFLVPLNMNYFFSSVISYAERVNKHDKLCAIKESMGSFEYSKTVNVRMKNRWPRRNVFYTPAMESTGFCPIGLEWVKNIIESIIICCKSITKYRIFYIIRVKWVYKLICLFNVITYEIPVRHMSVFGPHSGGSLRYQGS